MKLESKFIVGIAVLAVLVGGYLYSAPNPPTPQKPLNSTPDLLTLKAIKPKAVVGSGQFGLLPPTPTKSASYSSGNETISRLAYCFPMQVAFPKLVASYRSRLTSLGFKEIASPIKTWTTFEMPNQKVELWEGNFEDMSTVNRTWNDVYYLPGAYVARPGAGRVTVIVETRKTS